MFELLKFSLISTGITGIVAILLFFYEKKTISYSDIYDEATYLYKNKSYKAALAKLKQGVKKFPDKVELHYNKGLCELKLNLLNNAKESFLKALSLQNDNDTLYNLGYVEMLMQNFSKAKEYFETLYNNSVHEADLLFNLGVIYKQEDNLEKAKEFLHNAIEQSPEKSAFKYVYIEVLETLFEQYGETDVLDELMKMCDSLLLIYPNDEDIIYKKAISYAKTGDWEHSINYCERLYSLNPKSYRALSQQGLALFCKGETNQAIEMYEKAIELAPDVPDTYMNLVFAYDKAGEIESAIDLVKIFLKKFPDNISHDLAQDYLDKKLSGE